MKIILITQARIGSSRLPGKVLLKIGDKTLLDIHLSRVRKSKLVDEFIVATTMEDHSDLICEIATSNNFKSYKGSLNDVLDRFYQAAILHQPDWVVRVTSDCPLIDSQIIDEVVRIAIKGDYDYCANILTEDFPDGQDVEVFKMDALKRAWSEAILPSDREHVTPFIRNNSDFKGGELFKAKDVLAPANYNKIRMTVDEKADFEMMKWLIEKYGTGKTWLEYVNLMLANPDKLVNSDILRNEGYLKSLNNN